MDMEDTDSIMIKNNENNEYYDYDRNDEEDKKDNQVFYLKLNIIFLFIY